MPAAQVSGEDPGDTCERMVYVADRLVRGVRHSAEAVAESLDGLEPHELTALAVVLAAMVDPGQEPENLLAWTEWGRPEPPRPRTLRPCDPAWFTGDRTTWAPMALTAAHTAYARGERHPHVVAGEREYQRRRGQRRKAEQRARAAAARPRLTAVPASTDLTEGAG